MTKKQRSDTEYELEIGKAIEMLGAPPPMVGDRPMTIGDIIVQMVPGLASRETDKAVRLWRIATGIDASKERYIILGDLDFKLLETVLLSDERPVWVKVNLQLCFDEAKKRAEATRPE